MVYITGKPEEMCIRDSIYGAVSFEDYLVELRRTYPDIEIAYYQSNVEGLSLIHI